MENNQQDPQQAEVRIYEYAAQLLIDQKMHPDDVKNTLVQQGLDEESAAIVVDNLEEQISAAKKERSQKDILYGSLWLVGGLAVTLFTYSSASGGGTYVVTWGAIIFGAIQLFRGLSNA